MKSRLSFAVALGLSVVLIGQPLVSLAYGLDRTSLRAPAGSSRTTTVGTNFDSAGFAGSRPVGRFAWTLLNKRSNQEHNAGVTIPGQTVTMLPDGRLLKTGGLEQQGPLSTVTIEGAGKTAASVEPSNLQRSRAFHTATMLPDGKVLIVGGIGSDGHVVDSAEVYDPNRTHLSYSNPPDLDPRSSILNPPFTSLLACITLRRY